MSTYNYKPGLGLAAAYQVSGKPFVSGTINAQIHKPRGPSGIGPAVVSFPNVTSWVMVINHDAAVCRVGFSQNGVNRKGPSPQGNYIVLGAKPANVGPTVLGPLELKVTEVWLSGSTNVDVIAGLTYIDSGDVNNSSVSPNGTNWSGSAGAQVG